ncbi:hypothetical protein SAMN04490244_1226 [Tranquillimonas rosea]|uniref:DUF4148 domain-containing protein n=1 Tax=Tranquillimonas rosea TaxID=641238 RepID=A0A1H9X9J2_9RHOB|nr:hypothetical protein [Tranquillimonas rosea]SES42795.1 hypothetical protein SAMN04490244_1226 [Tranquillimonas rosea]
MKTIFATTAIAVTALAGAASANPQLEASAQTKLNRYHVSADAGALSDAQLAEIQAIETNDTAGATNTRSQLIAAVEG